MAEEQKGTGERTIAAITTTAALTGIAFGVVSAFESNFKMFWGSVFVALGLIGLGVFFLVSKTQKHATVLTGTDDDKPSFHRTYHLAWAALAFVLSAVAILSATYYCDALTKEKELVIHVRPIDKYKTTTDSDGFGFGFSNEMKVVVNAKTDEVFHMMPHRVYFELFKNPRIEFVRVDEVRVIIEKHEPIPERVEQRIEKIRFVPTIKFVAHLTDKEKDTKGRLVSKCRPQDRIDADPIFLDDKYPSPFSVLVFAREGGIYTLSFEAEVSHKNTTQVLSVGSIRLFQSDPAKEMPAKEMVPAPKKTG